VLEADVPLALDVIADIVLNPVFDPAELEIERGVILQEIGQVLDTPDDIIFDWLQEVAYPDQPLGRAILGPSERVSGFTRDDLRDFVAEHYRPERMIVAAAGAVDHEAIVRECQALFGPLARGGGERGEAGVFGGGERRVRKRLEQAHLALAFETPGFRDPGIYTSQIFSTALGGGMSSRLFQEVREKRGLCYSIYASTGAHAETGLMTIYAGTSGEDIAALSQITLDELKRSAEDMSEAEVARARAQMKAGLLMGLESPSSRAERLARLVATWDRVPSLDETVERIDAVDVGEVRDFAGRLIATAPALALYGPVGRAPSLERLRERLAA
jgi:predicted Zn-dependent peptidase